MKKLRNNQAFSLLELIFTMSLVSILGLSVVTNSTTADPAVQSAMLKTAADIRFAQDRAMITGVNHGFRTLSSSRYEIYEQSAGNPITDPSTSAPMQINLDSDFKGVRFSGSYEIEFNSFGQPITGGGTAVSLQKDSTSRTFNITNNTGLIRLP